MSASFLHTTIMSRRLLTIASLCWASALVLSGCASSPHNQLHIGNSLSEISNPEVVSANSKAKNIILFISDGASSGTWDMASYWEHGRLGEQPYDLWPVKLGMTTYPANTGQSPSRGAAPSVSYDPIAAWSLEPTNEKWGEAKSYFSGYHYVKANYTDSAAAGTALATGIKTYNSGISVDDFGKPLRLITEIAKESGRATGVVTSVPFSHATPAVFGARNVSRSAYGDIAREMILGETLDVIIGTGNPDFDENGSPRAPNFEYVGATEWQALKAGSTTRKLIQETAVLEQMAHGAQLQTGPFIAVPKVGATLQFQRTETIRGQDGNMPSGVAQNPNLPDLPTLTKAALNSLSKDEDGFFLMVEGGAVDWAAHANDTGRVIEEQVDFNAAVTATLEWLTVKNLLDETLVIVVTDHGNGMPMGPQSDTIAFQPVENRGKGKLPGIRWHHPTHTNENTRLWATGPGSKLLETRVRFYDKGFVEFTAHNQSGATIDNTDVFVVMKEALVGAGTKPE